MTPETVAPSVTPPAPDELTETERKAAAARALEVKQTQLKVDVMVLAQSGLSYRKIAAQLGTSPATAHRIVKTEMEVLVGELSLETTHLRALQLERVRAKMVQIEKFLVPRQTVTVVGAGKNAKTTTSTKMPASSWLFAWVKLAELEMKLCGTAAPTRLEISAPAERSMSDAELEERRQTLQRQLDEARERERQRATDNQIH